MPEHASDVRFLSDKVTRDQTVYLLLHEIALIVLGALLSFNLAIGILDEWHWSSVVPFMFVSATASITMVVTGIILAVVTKRRFLHPFAQRPMKFRMVFVLGIKALCVALVGGMILDDGVMAFRVMLGLLAYNSHTLPLKEL